MTLGSLGGLFCSSSGTLGVLVRKPNETDVFLLSCSHVIANCGQFGGAFGDLQDFRKVVQQPVSDPCDAGMNRVGLLQDGFSVLIPAAQGNTTSDVALALLDGEVAAATSNIQPAIGNSITEFATEPPSDWQHSMPTKLLGAMNPGVPGFIIGYNEDTAEDITFPEVGAIRFTGLVRYATRSEEGYSGGPVIDDRNRLLGIHVAGSTGGQGIGLFFPIGPYLIEKGLVLV